jgi:hypothetical protein
MDELHHPLCTNRTCDIIRMKKILASLLKPSKIHINTALRHAVENGHVLCVNFLFSIDANVDPGELLEIAALPTNFNKSSVFGMILDKGCTQKDVDIVLGYLGSNGSGIRLETQDFDIIKIIIERGFRFEYFDYLFHTGNGARRYKRLPVRCMLCPKVLKYLLLNGAVVDYRQLPYENLSEEQIDKVSLIHDFADEATNDRWTELPTETYHECLYMLHQCGANLWDTNRFLQTPLDIVEANIKMEEDGYMVDPDDTDDHEFFLGREMKRCMSELMSNPRSLQSQCRISLMRHLGPRYLKCIEKLPTDNYTASTLQFLRGDDMKATPKLSEEEIAHLYVKKEAGKLFQLAKFYYPRLSLDMQNRLMSRCVDVSAKDTIQELNKKLRNMNEVAHEIIDHMSRFP